MATSVKIQLNDVQFEQQYLMMTNMVHVTNFHIEM